MRVSIKRVAIKSTGKYLTMSFSDTIPQTMFDFRGFYDAIAEQMPDGCRLIELGVADGASAIYLAEKLQSIGKKFHLHMVDSCAYGGQEQRNTIIRNIVGCGLANSITFMEMDSLNASLKFPDGYFHAVFIDSGHTFELTKAECRLFYKKVMDDWFLSGHDASEKEVKDAIDEVFPAGAIDIVETEKKYNIWVCRKKIEIILK